MLLPVTIGIPVYNEEQYIEHTILCALSQPVLQIIIGDNASTDKTSAICQAMAEQHKRIKYVRHEKNMGPAYNFIHCITTASTRYFMFLGAHDSIADNHVLRLLEALSKEKAVGAYAKAAHIDKNNTVFRTYDYPYHRALLSDSPLTRLMALVKNLSDGTIVHGLYEREIYAQAFCDPNLIPGDLFCVGHMALHGRLVYVNDITYFRGGWRNETQEEKQRRYADFFSYVDTDIATKYLGQRFELTALRHFILLNQMYPDIMYKKTVANDSASALGVEASIV